MAGYLQNPETGGSRKPVTVPRLIAMRGRGEKITVVTAYDAPTAAWAEAAGIDVVLVGDSLGTVIQGLPDTLPVTLDEMIYHARCVRRTLVHPLLVVDLPFGTFQRGVDATVDASIRVLKESGAAAVKIEGGERVLDAIAACTRQDIPVMGHLGLTPQSVHAFGGFRRQGKDADSARRIIDDARRLQDAGVFSIVLECVPDDLAKAVTEAVEVPTIGIGAGPHCSGQVLVMHDLLGMLPRTPSFVRRYAEVGQTAVEALQAYRDDVREGRFPQAEDKA
ncbi:MAG: 3-methyl-2-oxobutanoate hydroxymethyltransferase [Candidatus Dadabacteria bacterium]|nr:MAG: 3-methyl-2-oxobutanoate hydroxymethyltransferase [Candidatus Dadabacteria bacterium]